MARLARSGLAPQPIIFNIAAVGSVYLLWLAFVILKAGPPQSADLADKTPIGFVGGGLLLAINPKAWAMAVGVAGSFSDIASNPFALALILGSVFAVAATMSLSLWTLAGSFLAKTLTAAWQWHLFNTVMAGLLVLSIVSFWI